MSCFSETGSSTTLHLKYMYFIYLFLNPCLLGPPRHQHFWIAQIHGPLHQNGKLYLMVGSTLYPCQVHWILLRWFIQPIGPLEVFWLTSMKFEVNKSEKIKKRTGLRFTKELSSYDQIEKCLLVINYPIDLQQDL